MNARTLTDSLFIIALLAVFNIGLVFGMPSIPFVFRVEPFLAGEWWRLFTWPLVHAGRYHAALDAIGFLSGFVMLHELTRTRRALVVFLASAGSLALPLALGSSIWLDGLCGLSGPAHGVMAAAGLHLARDGWSRNDRATAGLAGGLVAVVAAKSVWEAVTGMVAFTGLHPGAIGAPVAACHLGGVIGGIIGYCLFTGRALPWQRHV